MALKIKDVPEGTAELPRMGEDLLLPRLALKQEVRIFYDSKESVYIEKRDQIFFLNFNKFSFCLTNFRLTKE